MTLAENQAKGGTATVSDSVAGGAGGGGLSCGSATITNTVFTDNLAIGGARTAPAKVAHAVSGGASTGAAGHEQLHVHGQPGFGGAGYFGSIAEAGGLGVGSNGPNIEVSNTNFIGNSAIGGGSSDANENMGPTRALGAAYPLSFSHRTRARRPHSPTAISCRTSRSAGRVRTVRMVKVAACS